MVNGCSNGIEKLNQIHLLATKSKIFYFDYLTRWQCFCIVSMSFIVHNSHTNPFANQNFKIKCKRMNWYRKLFIRGGNSIVWCKFCSLFGWYTLHKAGYVPNINNWKDYLPTLFVTQFKWTWIHNAKTQSNAIIFASTAYSANHNVRGCV